MKAIKYIISSLLVSIITYSSVLVAAEPKNVIFILTDDQRYDELGVMNKALHTPNLDKLANGGVHFKNAFVTTSLCSPSRASILTGQYMHNHGVVDNNAPPREGTVYFPQFLQKSGYQTSFIGKWHMGEQQEESKVDAPQPGFDHWVSFAGQGRYFPRVRNGKTNQINVDGEHVSQKGYITDELTDYAINWLNKVDQEKPFFMYLSHKALHSNFSPAPRHKNDYPGMKITPPESQADSEDNYKNKPMWVRNQRNSWHGVDFPFHSELNIQSYQLNYHRALSAVDESVGRIQSWLSENNLSEDTVIMFMGDNGFLFGEHGLIDKRNAYEESMRVPLIAYAPSYFPAGEKVTEMALNIDIAPTILDIAGIEKPKQFEGDSFLPLAKGKKIKTWRNDFLYEYYWEFNYPHTPTTFALREDRYKYIQYHGVWDLEELYDLQEDPKELNNLIYDPKVFEQVVKMRDKLYSRLANNNNQHVVPYSNKYSHGAVFRGKEGSPAAVYPEAWMRTEKDADLHHYGTPDRKKLQRMKDKKRTDNSAY